MTTNMTRDQMINFIFESNTTDLFMSSEIQDGWCEHVLLHGIKGLHDYTDEELRQKVEDLTNGN